jgi:XTP/dITP diphosphohydrolase
MKQLLFASRNKHKAEEINDLLREFNARVLTLHDFPAIGEIEEDAGTLEGNALKKAQVAFAAAGIPAFADDTGLEVFYLNDAPGVYSSRYAGPGATYADNVRLLLKNLRGVPPRRRAARFRAVVVFVPEKGKHHLVQGICNGNIIEQPRGTKGFGYDPVFVPDGHDQTFAEMDLATKNSLSHRARAMTEFKSLLSSLGW